MGVNKVYCWGGLVLGWAGDGFSVVIPPCWGAGATLVDGAAGCCASLLLLAGTALVAPLTPPFPVAAAFAGALEARSPRPFFSRLISTRPPRVRVFLPSVA